MEDTLENNEVLDRSVRLTRIQHLLFGNTEGITTRELANLCGVCIRTIQRDIHALESLGIPLTQDGDRYNILKGYSLPPVSFSLTEAVVVFLISRLALRQMDEFNPHVEGALTKIAQALPSAIEVSVKKNLDVMSQKGRKPEATYIFEKVALAWATHRRMKIAYLSSHSDETKEWLLEPYLMEMTGVGYSAYVIGQASREGKEGIITFKLDRIKEAEVLNINFSIPLGLDLTKSIGTSWGIMWGDDVDVWLKFSSEVSRRVKESNWNPSQIVEDLPNGGCLFKVRVSGVLEITPWIRSWGADVEVLEPISLRDDFKRWSKQLYSIYSK
jgi:predicted DNA-binding transcriptional regulator YafY